MTLSTKLTKRVVVWGTGFVGKMVIPEVLRHPAFELVGVGVSSAGKVGKDVGEICGIGPVGVAATDDVDALLGLRPDALVHYGPTAAKAAELELDLEHMQGVAREILDQEVSCDVESYFDRLIILVGLPFIGDGWIVSWWLVPVDRNGIGLLVCF